MDSEPRPARSTMRLAQAEIKWTSRRGDAGAAMGTSQSMSLVRGRARCGRRADEVLLTDSGASVCPRPRRPRWIDGVEAGRQGTAASCVDEDPAWSANSFETQDPRDRSISPGTRRHDQAGGLVPSTARQIVVGRSPTDRQGPLSLARRAGRLPPREWRRARRAGREDRGAGMSSVPFGRNCGPGLAATRRRCRRDELPSDLERPTTETKGLEAAREPSDATRIPTGRPSKNWSTDTRDEPPRRRARPRPRVVRPRFCTTGDDRPGGCAAGDAPTSPAAPRRWRRRAG